ncbi:MAG: hypothetical protein IH840_05885 [Candidatus Heimdallarchaeota archaeon]|nr:hypothetical protein [Candidatus Heimdallarchaeota archaeon]
MKIKKSNKFMMLVISVLVLSILYNTPVLANKDTVVIGTTDSIRNLDPSDAYDYFSSNTLVQITHGLMEMPVDSTDAVKGPIVDSFTVSDDATIYTFELKADIKFSDGEVFDADAMKWLLDRSVTLGGDPGFLLADVIDNVVASGQTLTINLSSPDATFLQRLTYTVAWPVSPMSLEQNTIGGDPDSIPAGLGAYKITSWTKGTELIFETNPEYFGDAPQTDKIVVKFYTDASTLLTALESGEIDVAHKQFGPDEIESITGNADLNSVTKETAGIRYLVLNVEKHTEVVVRQAIAAAVDRAAITSTVFADLNEPIYTMVPKIFSSSKDSFEDGTLAQVTSLMEGAGYSSTNKYAMDFWYSPSHYGSEEIFVAELVRDQLEVTGFFDITIKNTEWSTYVGQFETMGFFLLGWWFDYPDPSNYIDPFAGAGAFSLGTNYTSTEMDGYISTMLTDTDPTARANAQKSAQDLMAEDVMTVPLFSMLKQFSGLQTTVTGYVLEPSENVHYNSIVVASDDDGGLPIGLFTSTAIFLVISAGLMKLRRRN